MNRHSCRACGLPPDADGDIRGRLADLRLIHEDLLGQVIRSRLLGNAEHEIAQLLDQYDQLAEPDTP